MANVIGKERTGKAAPAPRRDPAADWKTPAARDLFPAKGLARARDYIRGGGRPGE
jgi:hypothetical protein